MTHDPILITIKFKCKLTPFFCSKTDRWQQHLLLLEIAHQNFQDHQYPGYRRPIQGPRPPLQRGLGYYSTTKKSGHMDIDHAVRNLADKLLIPTLSVVLSLIGFLTRRPVAIVDQADAFFCTCFLPFESNTCHLCTSNTVGLDQLDCRSSVVFYSCRLWSLHQCPNKYLNSAPKNKTRYSMWKPLLFSNVKRIPKLSCYSIL